MILFLATDVIFRIVSTSSFINCILFRIASITVLALLLCVVALVSFAYLTRLFFRVSRVLVLYS